MKRLAITCMFLMGIFFLANAQQVMNCKGSRTGARVKLLPPDGEMIRIKVNWDEGSTFSGAALALENAKCASCPRLGGIGRPHPIEAIYKLERLDDNQRVKINWGPRGTDRYCGTDQITIEQGLLCLGSKSNARVEFVSRSGGIVKVKVYWNEGSGFNQKNLEVVNGTLVSNFLVGGSRAKEANVEIKVTDNSKEVIVRWGQSHTKLYCGDGELRIGA
ncbi:MAG: hypothetical protein AAF206_10605 [Bacteroidota bacterium]